MAGVEIIDQGGDMSKITLKNLDDCRRFLARVINELRSGKLEESRGRAIIYGIATLQSVIKDNDLEQRMNQMETRMEERSNGDFGKTA